MTNSEKNLVRSNIAHFDFTPEEVESVVREIANMRHDRAVINAATNNFRFQTTWSRMPKGEFSGTVAGWYKELIKLVSHVLDIHFKDESEKPYAFILVSPDVNAILSASGSLEHAETDDGRMTALSLQGTLHGIPVYVDFYLRPDVLYIGSGHVSTPGAVAIDSLSVIKVENMFDLNKLKQ